jgi:hypothetical protein
MIRLPALGLAALILAGGPAGAAPLSRVIEPKTGNSACFARDYDAAHLRRYPHQATQSVMVSLKYDASESAPVGRIMLRQRGRAEPLHVVGSCNFEVRANRDIQGNRLIRAFQKESGHDCLAITAPASAEEGGYFLVDLAADGRTLMLYLEDHVRAWRGPQTGEAKSTRLGREDRVFRLNRTAASVCAPMERAFEGP